MTSYFTEEELSCPCCGGSEFNQATLAKFNELRELVGEALPMSSGYRCPDYNTIRGFTQTHSTGQAGDLAVSHRLAYLIVSYALECGFTGIGVSQKGQGRFIHLDDLEQADKRPRPHIWSY